MTMYLLTNGCRPTDSDPLKDCLTGLLNALNPSLDDDLLLAH